MTQRERVIVSAYTGYLMCGFDELHKYIEEKLNRPVWTHEMADHKIQEEIRIAVEPDFLVLCKNKEEA